jgi:hypothetical protein
VELYGCIDSFVLSLQRRSVAETDAAQAEAAGGRRASVEWLCQCYNRADELRRELDPKLEEIATRPFFHLLR